MFKYSINLIWSSEDDCYVATIPEFSGLSAFGETPEEAAEEARIAAEGFIKVLEEDGCELPSPNSFQPYSGQTRLRMPKTLHANLSHEAKREGVSLNTYLVSLLSEGNAVKNIEKQINSLKSVVLHNILEDIPKSTSTSTSFVEVNNLGTWEKSINSEERPN